ncbi:hypothetical protein ACRALDRAFT_1072695 [Sodiomyces alcalophilus JCM 7366]|uniref:uncharacterized protein n=1 Tax=Sodiomyces alcalophilus JCM 7366 TaxID=591952 RepID=UPI0039B531A8
MEYRNKAIQAWLMEANRLPTRNKVPPGRLPPSHLPSSPASTQKEPGNETGNSSKDASPAKSGGYVALPSTPDSAITKTSCLLDLGSGGVKLTVEHAEVHNHVDVPNHVDAQDHVPDSPRQPGSSKTSIPREIENENQADNDQKQVVLRAVTPALKADEPEVESPVAPRSSMGQSAWEISIDGVDDTGPLDHVADLTEDDGTSSPRDTSWAMQGTIDIRNEIAPKHKLENVGGILRKDPWMDEGDDDFIFRTRSFYHAFIVDWSSRIPRHPRPTFLEDGGIEEHWFRDVDTETGRLREPVEQPPTFVDMHEEMELDPNLRDRRRDWTSAYLITRENKVRKRKARWLHHARTQAHGEVEGRLLLPPIPPPRKVEVDCVLRPAKPSDLAGIVDIYNWEIKRGIRAWDTELVDEEDFRRIGRSCKDAKLPFIVAVGRPVDLNDPSNWPSKVMWEEFKAWTATSVVDPPQFKKREPTVIGFAFMQPYDRGFGLGRHVGRTTVQLSVFVHHEYRRKHVGTALIDRLLTHILWNNIGTDGRFNQPLPNRIIIETLMRGKADPDFSWMSRMLRGFHFQEVGHMYSSHRTQRGKNSEWLDKYIWQHDASMDYDPGDSDPGIWEGGLAWSRAKHLTM